MLTLVAFLGYIQIVYYVYTDFVLYNFYEIRDLFTGVLKLRWYSGCTFGPLFEQYLFFCLWLGLAISGCSSVFFMYPLALLISEVINDVISSLSF